MRLFRSAASSLLAAIMAVLTVVLTPGPLLVLREQEGRGVYLLWYALLVGACLAFGEPSLLVPIASAGLLVFYFFELESAGFSLRRSALLSVVGSGLLIFFIFVLWVRHLGFTPIDFLRGRFEYLASEMKTLPASFQFDVEQLFSLVPSLFFIVLGMMLWLGLLIEPAFCWLIYRKKSPHLIRQLDRFRVPGGMIWIFILSLAGAFIQHHFPVFQNICLNLFNVLSFLYFLQGVAILSYFFSVTRTGAVWRILIYALLIGNLSPFLAGLGVADFWLDFRARLRRKTTESLL